MLHLIDSMTIHKGYGSWQMADHLNKHGYRTHAGVNFTSVKINRILRDSYYCGFLGNGETSEALQTLRIRGDDTRAQILYILDQRNCENEEKRHIAIRTKGSAMLSGNIFCAHCGGRLILDQYNGEVRRFCNYYAIANNRSKLHKFRYIMEYSFYKTLACKYRTSKRKVIAKYRVGKDIGVQFQDKYGNEHIRLLWKGSLAREPHPLRKEADIIYKPKGILKKPGLGARMKANRCEWCGKETSALVMHQVRTLKELDDSQPWAVFMKKINRKTLVVCESCHEKMHSADCG